MPITWARSCVADIKGDHQKQLDKHYETFQKIQAARGLQADLHDFIITEEGTAIFTVYEIVQLDLTPVGKPFVGPVWDCLIQEVNLTTGGLIFEWRATDYYHLGDSFNPIGHDGEENRAYDFFHINSIEKDHLDNYLISARYMHSLTYIDGRTGHVLWVIGGKRNMFTDLSWGRATSFAYQHDARWTANYTEITMFDNGSDNLAPNISNLPDTRGLRIQVDQQQMTAKVMAEYMNPLHIYSISQGSYQILPNGHALLSYGNSPAYIEFTPEGEPLCDIHFAPQTTFGHGEVMSYRVLKYEWHGWPTTYPDVFLGIGRQGRLEDIRQLERRDRGRPLGAAGLGPVRRRQLALEGPREDHEDPVRDRVPAPHGIPVVP